MDYIKIHLSTDLDQIGSELKKTMDDIFGAVNPMYSRFNTKWVPHMDLYETPEQITIVAAVAGIKKDSIEIEINQRAVRISGARKSPNLGEKTKFRLAEIQYGKFDRILYLPAPIDTDRVSASFSAGMLTINMVKQQQTLQSKKIPVSNLDDELESE
ncbi:MAG: Hsp20/alpha crystallin family protein [Thermodesulfobacteriota bacterium]|nr:Hsp20/alpha crystallin family protein [Thermodesulfobacteriota bacterium]